MKCMLAVTLLLTSLASVAFADGPGNIPPPKKAIANLGAISVQLADGPGNIPPPGKTIKLSTEWTAA